MIGQLRPLSSDDRIARRVAQAAIGEDAVRRKSRGARTVCTRGKVYSSGGAPDHALRSSAINSASRPA
jgi:hypothetical protein